MEIRDLRLDEIEELIDHLALVFAGTPRDRFELAYHQDSSFVPEDTKVVIEDGKIVSAIRCANRPVYIGGTRIEMGGIGGVSTNPAYRGCGHSSLLLKAQIEYMEQNSFDISMLFTGITGFYARLGWEAFPEHSCSVAVPKKLSDSGDQSYTVRPYDEETDLDAVMRCYDEYSVSLNLAMVRSGQYWRDGHSKFLGCLPWLVAERDGAVCAYITGNTERVHEACCIDGHMSAFIPLAHSAMSAAINDGKEAIGCHMPFCHPFLDQLRVLSGTRLSHSIGEGMMLRVIRLQPLLDKLVPAFCARLSRSAFPVTQPMTVGFTQSGQHTAIRVHGQSVRTCDEQAELELNMGQREFFLLLCGVATIDQVAPMLAMRGQTIPSPYMNLLRALFPKQEHCYYASDHF